MVSECALPVIWTVKWPGGLSSSFVSGTYLSSVGLYVTMYFSMGCAFRSICVCHDTRTAVGVRNVTVMFSGVAGMVPIITIIACYYAIIVLRCEWPCYAYA